MSLAITGQAQTLRIGSVGQAAYEVKAVLRKRKGKLTKNGECELKLTYDLLETGMKRGHPWDTLTFVVNVPRIGG